MSIWRERGNVETQQGAQAKWRNKEGEEEEERRKIGGGGAKPNELNQIPDVKIKIQTPFP